MMIDVVRGASCVPFEAMICDPRMRAGGARDEELSRTPGAACTARSCTSIGVQIMSGELKPGDPLPPEDELTSDLAVSRTVLA